MSTNETTSEPTMEPGPAETPVAAAPVAAAAVAPVGHPHHMRRAGVAVALMVAGSLFFATFTFGAGFMLRGAIDRHFAGRGAVWGQGFGRDGGQGFGQGFDGRGQCPGGRGGQGGRGMRGGRSFKGGRGFEGDTKGGYGRGYGQGSGQPWTPDAGSAPSTVTP